MKLAIMVVGGSSSAAANGGGTATTAPADTSAKIDGTAMPAEGWEGRDPVLPAKASGTVHDIAFDATEKIIEVAPGRDPADVDVQRSGARADPARQGGRHVPHHADEQGHDGSLDRLPRQQGGVERRDAHHPAR